MPNGTRLSNRLAAEACVEVSYPSLKRTPEGRVLGSSSLRSAACSKRPYRRFTFCRHNKQFWDGSTQRNRELFKDSHRWVFEPALQAANVRSIYTRIHGKRLLRKLPAYAEPSNVSGY